MDTALALEAIPAPARAFTRQTFDFIDADRPHEVAAAFALGREHIIPLMFRGILEQTGVSEAQAPGFHYYLKRHIHLDDGFHAPLSLRLLNSLCGEDERRTEQALAAAELAVSARVRLWDAVLESLQDERNDYQRVA